jgi:amino acid transporter
VAAATNGFYALFWHGLDVGGPAALIWSWPIIVFGQLMVSPTFAEAASRYPLAGGFYQWARHLVSGCAIEPDRANPCAPGPGPQEPLRTWSP